MPTFFGKQRVAGYRCMFCGHQYNTIPGIEAHVRQKHWVDILTAEEHRPVQEWYEPVEYYPLTAYDRTRFAPRGRPHQREEEKDGERSRSRG